MSLPVVNLTSDSDSSSSSSESGDNVNNKARNSRINASQTDSSHNQRSDFQNVQATHSYGIQSDVIKDPLFKILFRDELTSRKYRQRLEDIIKFVLTNEVDENIQNQSSLVLDIYDPKLDKVSTSQTQAAQSFMQAAQQGSSNSTNYIHQMAHSNIVSSNTKKKIKHKRKLQQSEESTPRIPSSPCVQQAVPQAISQVGQETPIDVSHIKLEKPDDTIPSDSKQQPSDKSELPNSEKPVIQTQHPSPALPTLSLIKEVPEATINSTIEIKQESPQKSNPSNSEKKLEDSHKLQKTNRPIQQSPLLPQSSATPSSILTQEAPKIPTNTLMHLQPDIQNNTNLLNFEKIPTSEKLEPKYPPQQQYSEIPSHSTAETHSKPELGEDDFNSRKHKLESQDINDSYNSKKPRIETKDEMDTSLTKGIYEVILDDSNYSQLETNLETCFENSAIKIGSYGYYDPDKSVFLSKDGLSFAIQNINGRRPKILSIELDDILKVLVHFSKIRPALFFFVTTRSAIQIRTLLSMDDPSGPYFDPNSLDLKHQRIAILPARISDESEGILRELFKNKEMVEINAQVSDDLANLATTSYKNKSKHLCSKYNKEISDPIGREPPHVNNLSGHNTNNASYFCRIIRVGSLEYAKKRAMLLSNNGLKFCVPHLDNVSQIVTIDVDIRDVIKVEIYFSKYIPMLFFYITTKAARKIRNKIGMTDKSDFYLDPEGDETQNKIIILPQTLSEGCHALKEWFLKKKIKKLDKETAKDILARSFKNNKEKIYMTITRTRDSFSEANISRLGAVDGSDKNDERVVNSEHNAARVKFAENNDNKVQYAVSTAKINTNTEQRKTKPTEEDVETIEIISNSCIRIKAECIKVGSYRYNKDPTSVIISIEGLNFDLPKIHDDAKHKMYIVVKLHEITELWYFFSINTCFLFFTTTSICAQNIRTILEMYNTGDKAGYYDPDSENLSHKRLAIVFNQSNFKYRSILKTIFCNLKVNSIKDYKTARKMMRNKL
ncbi:uncharacterized protein LOC100680484 isoform X2 [Nasonia vitripennis]|uniref:Uncharacterized protein n=1 Tax=Nasonia vitripennis TaxID=7425 RepID=A0A7M7Q964_NASVI|nr:uncharacterized protein LOC100680484 isoform X2 [Nasonia vitripennis]